MAKESQKKLRLDEDGEPYAICPKCHGEIYYVEEKYTITNRLFPSDESNIEWEAEDDYDDREDYRLVCPKCGKVIAQNEDEVLDLFLE